MGNDKSICDFGLMTDEAKNFVKESGIKKYKCLEFDENSKQYSMNKEICGCLDTWFISDWDWYNANDKKYRKLEFLFPK